MSDKIPELNREKNILKEENEASKAEKAEQVIQSAESTIAIPTLQSNEEEEGSSNSALEEKPTKRYRVPNWFFDSSSWIDRKGVADSSLSTASNAFKQYFWPKLHENVQPYTVERLEYYKYGLHIWRFTPTDYPFVYREIIPIASIPPPDYVVGFKWINIYYVDDKIMNFIKCSARLLQNHKIIIELNRIGRKTTQRWINAVHDFCLDYKYKIDEFILYNLDDFNQIFPGILDDHIQLVRLWMDINNIDDFGNILNWLTKQSNNGKQKIINFFKINMALFTQLSNRIKKFKIALQLSCSLHQRFEDGQNVEEFTLENEETNELLTLYRKDEIYYPHYYLYYLARYPKGEEHWKEDGENKIKDYNNSEEKNIHFDL